MGLRLIGSLFLISTLLGAGAASAGAPEIGAVRDLVAVAYGTPPEGERHSLALLEPVVADQRLETVPDGGLHVRFLDETDLWLGGGSDLVLDEVVYTDGRSAERFVVELGPGLFRLVTGLMAHNSYEIRTPAAVIGVRGTDFAVAVAADGATRVTVYAGQVTVAPRGGGVPSHQLRDRLRG
jgi:hypothetical protein